MLLSRNISYGGVLLALILLFLTASFYSPFADFALFSLTSVCIMIMVMNSGVKGGLLLYCASCAAVFVFFGLSHALPFVMLFGIYPLLKGMIESAIGYKKTFLIKIPFFVIAMTVSLLIFTDFLGISVLSEDIVSRIEGYGAPGYILIVVAGTVVLIIYDYVLTLSVGLIGRFWKTNVRK